MGHIVIILSQYFKDNYNIIFTLNPHKPSAHKGDGLDTRIA